MKVAFTFNLRVNDTAEQAEFDSEETVERIIKALESFGHSVFRVELSQPIVQVINQLTTISPDLIFNIGEGLKGRLREAFWPAIFEELKIPFTGADAYSLALTLNKDLTKKVVSDWGVLVPRGRLVTDLSEIDSLKIDFPLFIKPNFEGSSKGIDESNIIESEEKLKIQLTKMMQDYPEGILVEEYIDGTDITVPFLEIAPNPVLAPIVYVYGENITVGGKFSIYDYKLKNDLAEYVSVEVANLDEKTWEQIKKTTNKVLSAVNCHDFGRLDFRLTADGKLYFLEINCLASLEKGAGIFLAGENQGISEEQLIHGILESAVKRYGISN